MGQWNESERGPVVQTGPAPDQPVTYEGDDALASSKSTRSPAFQFYPRDFLSDTNVDLMSATERGIYITLLCRCWLDCGLPTDLSALARMNRMKAAQFERLWTSGTLADCFYERDGKFQHKRLDKERKVQADYRKKQRENAEKRWQSHGNATALPERQSHGNALHLQSASATASAEKDVRRAPIIARRRLDAAWEGEKGLYVPQRKHSDFIGLRNHPNAERELLAWYEQVAANWQGSPGADMMAFWTARFNEQWPPPTTNNREPDWVRRARAGQ